MPINQDQKGRRAEEVAWHYLQRKGYQLLAQRYRTPYGEIDLICKDQGVLVMVEVKFRKQNVMEAIGGRQKQRIIQACEFFLAQYTVCDGYRLCSNHEMFEHKSFEGPKDLQIQLQTVYSGGFEGVRFDAVLMAPDNQIIHIQNAWEAEGF